MRLFPCLFLAVCHSLAAADGALPAHMTGVWATAESLYAGTASQSEMHLQEDGFGMFAGSSAALPLADGVEDGAPAPRAVIGFLFSSTLDGTTLTLSPRVPANRQAAPPALSCRYEEEGPKMICTGPDGRPIAMSRRSKTVPPEAMRMIATLRFGQ